MQKFITRAAISRPCDREINNQRSAYDVGPRYKAPVTAIQALVAIVTQHKVLPLRDHHFSLHNVVLQLITPAPVGIARIRLLGREVVAVALRHPLLVDHIILMQGNTVYINDSVAHAHMVAGNPDHALHQELPGIDRIIKDDDVPTLDRTIRQQLAGKWFTRKVKLINQQKITDEKRVLH